MSVPERRAMVERPGENLSVRRQCALLNLARSGVYRPGPVTGADDLALMRRIDELHLKWPFYGSRRMVFELNQAGHGVNRKRVHPHKLPDGSTATRCTSSRRTLQSHSATSTSTPNS